MREGKTWSGGGGLLFCNVFRLDLKESREVLSERKDITCRGAEDGKGSGTKSGKSGTRNLEADGIRR